MACESERTGPLVIGRVVHYRTNGSADPTRWPQTCVPALVTEVAAPPTDDHRVGLDVRSTSGGHFHPLGLRGGVAYDGSDTPQGETWHWGVHCPDGL